MFFLPVTIDESSIPTLVNGITTSTSIIIGIGAATIGLVFRNDIEKGDPKSRKLYYFSLGLFIIPIVYPWGSYIALAQKVFPFAVRYSFNGFLVSLWVILIVYIVIGKRWNLDSEKPKNVIKSSLTHDEIRYAILTVLYKKAEMNPNDCWVERQELLKVLNIPETTIDFNIRYLVEEQLISISPLLNIVKVVINSSGINAYEHKEENKSRYPFLTANIPIQIENKLSLINFG